jgi:spore coat polysaccharide biosynthesis protein SpsF
MTALILQARLDSSRLPGKAMLPLGGKPMILRVMEALKTVDADIHILACPEDCRAVFAPPAEAAGFLLSTGPKNDVLGRYCIAIRRHHADWVIRATGDNPFVFADAARALALEGGALGADYSGYSSLPYGAGVEFVSATALLRADAEAALEMEREHVCPYLYRHEELFLLHRPLAPRPWRGPDMRLTVDTAEDYGRAQQLWGKLSSFPRETRFLGERIISVYRELFRPGAMHNSNTVRPGAER